MYLALIDNRIQDINAIIESFTEQTEYVLFDFTVDTYSTIRDKISENFDGVAIIQHNYSTPEYHMVADSSGALLTNLAKDDPSLDTWGQYIEFLSWLKEERGVQYVDLLACDLWADPNWRYMIDTVRSEYGVYIRASIDKTGAGGNFILESDEVDMVGIYFTDKILAYRHAFFILPISSIISGYTDYITYTLPVTNPGTIKRIEHIVNINTFTNVISVISNEGSLAALSVNGTVMVAANGYPYESGYYAGILPCGIITQADLVNISKIVASRGAYIALKKDATVVTWGKPQWGNGNVDINDTLVNETVFICTNTVRSRLVNIVDVYATGGEGYAALTSTGEVVAWGHYQNGGLIGTLATTLSSGVSKIHTGTNYFVAVKTNGTAHWWTSGLYFSTTTWFTNATPVIDVILPYVYYPLFVRRNNSLIEIVTYNGSLIYTLPAGVKILRKARYYTPAGQSRHFIVLSNSTIVYIAETNVATVYTNATDVVTTEFLWAMIQNGTVIGNVGPLWTGATVDNPVRLVSTITSIGVIKSDNTFVWWGYNEHPYNLRVNSSQFPSGPGTLTNPYDLYLRMSSNIANIYPTYTMYLCVQKNGSLARTVPISDGFNTKEAGTNIYFEPPGSMLANSVVPLIIPYAPTVTPASFDQNTPTTISYYVSNPDLMGYNGRTYRLYNGATLLGTFYPETRTHTYVFSNVSISATGTLTLDIKDETNIVMLVVSFSVSVIPAGFDFEYTPIDLYSPTGVFDLSYNDQYNQIFFPGITYMLKDQNNTTMKTATVDASANRILFAGASSGSLQYGPNTLRIYNDATVVGNPMVINTVCFLEGTRILCMDKRTSKPKYRSIEKLKPGTLVKTLSAGFVPIRLIGHSTLSNSSSAARLRDSLYKCTKLHYPQITDDLYITGNHSILVPELSEKQRAELGANVYLTEGQFRLPAWLDSRANRWREPGVFRIWHFALESHDYYMNYGVYANGLLVESTSLRFMNELSGMELVQ